VSAVEHWPIDGIAFTFHVPDKGDESEAAWTDLTERDQVINRLITLKETHPMIRSNIGALELMKSDRCIEATGYEGENCRLKHMLPLYVGEGGEFERTFCCYGNNVDCSRCGAYAVFNAAYKQQSRID
ncbi:MAG: hypothetical protein OEZ23_01825, partial [Gammaproteobacteria bacterium]|nr:hypothetical protein [Gammaproteobacteria bacterium]